jgi:DNA modification methylase
LPQIFEYMKIPGLRYLHIIPIIHGGGSSVLYAFGIRVKHKPLLWFVKGTKPSRIEGFIEDVIYSSPPEKWLGEWVQSPTESEYIISKLTVSPKQIVLDPFMGFGTTGVATLKCDRKFIGIERQLYNYRLAKANTGRHLQGAVK